MEEQKDSSLNENWPDDDDDDLLCAMDIGESDQRNTDQAVKQMMPENNEEDHPCSTSETDSEEEVPLAQLMAVQRMAYESESDSSGVDRTYKPASSDSDSSDTSTVERESRKRKRVDDVKYRKRQKKTPCRLSTSARFEKESTQNNEIEQAKQKSNDLQNLLTLARSFHKKRLNLLLNSNDLQVSTVPADGNCFFSAVLASLEDTSSPQVLREKTCQHLLDHYQHYIGFLATGQMDVTEKLSLFQQEVNGLKENGRWKCSIGDCLPLAIANIFKRPIQIFSSSLSTPVQFVEPDLVQTTDSCFSIGYVAVRGEEHYEGVVTLRGANTTPEKNRCPHQDTPTASTSPAVTPHKRACYNSPAKSCSSRKKKRNPDQWERNVRKAKRSKGEAYTSCKGNLIQEKKVQHIDCTKCRFQCSKNIDSDARQNIFGNFYQLATYERQRSYICQMVESVSPVRSKGKKTFSRQYHLVLEEKRIRVCRTFFLATLDIGRKVVDHALEMKKHGVFTGEDRRGVASSGNKIDSETINTVKRHKESFPQMESHYAGKDTTKKYLSQDLNITKMYILYKEQCKKAGIRYVKESKYREVFCTTYNISFYKPKKDQCSQCSLYESRKLADTLDSETVKMYEDHQKKKKEARHEKEKDKADAKQNQAHYVATFDLQAVLNTPCSLVGELYYARKLSVYNLSFYSLGDQQGTCHLWDESNGKRGANEIATCLFKNTSSVCHLKRNVKEVTYFCDSCGGQNRNQFIAGSLLFSLSSNANLHRINHKFLTSGHSQMECDSIHSAIETAKKRTQVFIPAQWSTVISFARGGKRYISIPLKYGDVFDFKKFVKQRYPNMKFSVSGGRVNWLKIKWIQVRREAENSIFVNYGFNKEDFLEIKVLSGTRRKSVTTTVSKSPTPAYDSKLPISVAKKQDLLTLCRKEIIPTDFHSYYESLLTSNASVDQLPGPASDEEWSVEDC